MKSNSAKVRRRRRERDSLAWDDCRAGPTTTAAAAAAAAASSPPRSCTSMVAVKEDRLQRMSTAFAAADFQAASVEEPPPHSQSRTAGLRCVVPFHLQQQQPSFPSTTVSTCFCDGSSARLCLVRVSVRVQMYFSRTCTTALEHRRVHYQSIPFQFVT